MLAAGPLSVGDLATPAAGPRPAVSQHLKVLKDAGLVSEQAVALDGFTGSTRPAWRRCARQLDDFWDRALGGFRNMVEGSGDAEMTQSVSTRRFDVKFW